MSSTQHTKPKPDNGDQYATQAALTKRVIITIMVLDLKPPAEAELSAPLPLWPKALSYAVSYLFVAIIWINLLSVMTALDGLQGFPNRMPQEDVACLASRMMSTTFCGALSNGV